MFNIIDEVKKIEADIIAWRRELHKIPEIGLNLPKTVNFIKSVLDDMGIGYYTLLDGNALVAIIEANSPGKTLALRADTDGLPVYEYTGLPFASKNGSMHACGHDGHTAILLGVAKVLSENLDSFKGNVKLLFQPGEEYPGGAKPMIEQGALENPKVDRIMGLHLGDLANNIPSGKIAVCSGTMMAAVDVMKIEIKGKGSHGAYPHLSVDPIVIAAEVVSSFQNIISRQVNPIEPAVVSVTKISGGFNHNIIPDSVEIRGTIRTINPATRLNIEKRIEKIVKGITSAYDADYSIYYENSYPALVNSKSFTDVFINSALKIVPKEDIIQMTSPVMGAEDMSYFLEKVPGSFFYLSSIKEVDGIKYPHHNPKFDIDESLLWKGAALMVQTSIDWLNS